MAIASANPETLAPWCPGSSEFQLFSFADLFRYSAGPIYLRIIEMDRVIRQSCHRHDKGLNFTKEL